MPSVMPCNVLCRCVYIVCGILYLSILSIFGFFVINLISFFGFLIYVVFLMSIYVTSVNRQMQDLHIAVCWPVAGPLLNKCSVHMELLLFFQNDSTCSLNLV